MSAYNEAPAILREAVLSILKQTYEDFEFIIVNDNPENGELAEALLSLSVEDPRIAIVQNEKNLGLALSLNEGINAAHGKYICRMDADDISEPNRIERQLAYLKDNELDLVGSAMTVIDESGNPQYSVDSLPQSPTAVAKALRFNNCVPHPTWLGSRNLFSQLYRVIPLCEDYDFLIRSVLQGRRIGNVPERLVRYRMSQGSISRSHLFEQYLYQVELTMAYRHGKEPDPILAAERVSDKLSEEQARRYAQANAYFNTGLSLLRSKHAVNALGQLIRVPITSRYYLNKVYRLIRTAIIRG